MLTLVPRPLPASVLYFVVTRTGAFRFEVREQAESLYSSIGKREAKFFCVDSRGASELH